MKIEFIFEWRDFWIGFFWDQKKRILYFLPVPMLGLKIQFAAKPQEVVRYRERREVAPGIYETRLESEDTGGEDIYIEPADKGLSRVITKNKT